MMTNNIGESLNVVILIVNSYPIVWMVEFLRPVIMRWFDARRRKGEIYKKLGMPKVDKQYLLELPNA